MSRMEVEGGEGHRGNDRRKRYKDGGDDYRVKDLRWEVDGDGGANYRDKDRRRGEYDDKDSGEDKRVKDQKGEVHRDGGAKYRGKDRKDEYNDKDRRGKVHGDGGAKHRAKDRRGEYNDNDSSDTHRAKDRRGEVYRDGGAKYRGKDRKRDEYNHKDSDDDLFKVRREEVHGDGSATIDPRSDQNTRKDDSKKNSDREIGKDRYAWHLDGERGADGKGGRGKHDDKQSVVREGSKLMETRHSKKNSLSGKGDETRAHDGSKKSRKRKKKPIQRPKSVYIDVHDVSEEESDESVTLTDLEESVFHDSRAVNTKLRLADDLIEETHHKRPRHSSHP